MRRFGALFWVAAVLITGIANYAVKHMVQGFDDELTGVRRKIATEQKEIHALTASWTYLNQPDLLADQNRRLVGLVPVTPSQLERGIDDLPLRPAPAAPPPEFEAQTVSAVSAPPPPMPAAPAAARTVPAATAPPPHPARPSPPAVTAAAPVRATATQRTASLDALFAQVAGSR